MILFLRKIAQSKWLSKKNPVLQKLLLKLNFELRIRPPIPHTQKEKKYYAP